MRTIDDKRYISAKEYAQLKNLNLSRVSQLKGSGELSFVEFPDLGISLIDYELLELTNQEKRFAEKNFLSPTPLHKFSILDMGRYFMKTLVDLMEYKETTTLELSQLKHKNEDLEKAFLEKKGLYENCLNQIDQYKLTVEAHEKRLLELESLNSELEERNNNLQEGNNSKYLLIKELEVKISILESSKNSQGLNLEKMLLEITTTLQQLKKEGKPKNAVKKVKM